MKKSTSAAPGCHFDSFFIKFWTHFGIVFSTFFRSAFFHENTQKPMVFHHFYFPNPSIFRFIFHPFFDLRSRTPLGWHFWRQKHRSTLKMAIFGAPSDFKGYQNGPRISTFGPKNIKKPMTPNAFLRTGAEPAFP